MRLWAPTPIAKFSLDTAPTRGWPAQLTPHPHPRGRPPGGEREKRKPRERSKRISAAGRFDGAHHHGNDCDGHGRVDPERYSRSRSTARKFESRRREKLKESPCFVWHSSHLAPSALTRRRHQEATRRVSAA